MNIHTVVRLSVGLVFLGLSLLMNEPESNYFFGSFIAYLSLVTLEYVVKERRKTK